MEQKPFFLKSGKHDLYGVLFTPATADPEQVVLFVHPLFEEKKASHRVLVELARKLAEENTASLILDLTSCGDSEGGTEDFTPAKWMSDIQAGIAYLHERFNKPKTTLLGIRFGATLALQAASKNANIQNLILIDPIIKGGDYVDEILRQKCIREMMTFGEAKSDIETMAAELKKSGQLDIDGVMISEEFFNSLKAIDLDETDLSSINKILLIQESPKESLLPVYAELQKKSKALKIKLDLELLKCPPFWQAVDMAEFKSVCEVILKWKNR